MARFLKHIACEQCGSSDANGVYDDGSTYCYSCQTFRSGKISPYVNAALHAEEKENKIIALPSDVTQEYSEDAVKWICKYITLEQALRSGLLYSAYRNQVVFPFYDADKNLLAYQARNLSPVSKGKRYYTAGDVNALLPIYQCGVIPCRSIVLVEDVLSAVKVAGLKTGPGRDAMPLLGSGISRTKLSRLRPFYNVLQVFLDPDMFHKAQLIAKQAQMLGFVTKIVKAECDPKECSEQHLTKLLTSS